MVDVFISYARREIDRARPINEALQGFGLTTFFDIEGLDGSDEFPDEIDRALRAAQCVVGIWSPHALSRPWVKKEARVAASLQRLITVRIAPLVLEAHSTEFSGRHLSDLESFVGDVDHPGFLELMKAIAEKLNRPGLKQLVQMAARKAGPEVAPRAEAQAPAQAPSGPADSPSARAWAQIAQSLDKSHYRRFERAFETDPLAFNSVMEAEARVKALERWEGVDKADPAAIAQFLRAPGFAALEAHARAAMHQAVEARQRAEKEAVEEARQQEAQEQVRSVFQNRWSQLISSPFRRYWLSMLGHFSAATATSSVLLFIVGVLIRLLDGDSLYELVDAVAEGYIAALVYTAPPNLLLAAVFARNNSASSLSALIVIGVLIFGIITLAGCNAILGVLFTGGMLSWFGVKIFAVLRRKNVHRE